MGVADEGIQEYIDQALQWLISVYDPVLCGWGWLQHIPPNEQNTAEVVLALLRDASESAHYTGVIAEAAEKQLMVPTSQVTKDWIWVTKALLEVQKRGMGPLTNEVKLGLAISRGLDEVSRLWDKTDGGWPDTGGERSQVTWTALTLVLLHDELPSEQVMKAARYLERSQNSDGGWGLWRFPTDEIERLFSGHPRLISRASAQVTSNAASTAHALLALKSVGGSHHRIQAGKQWLLDHISPTGGWPVFQQVGIRGTEVYTYRHFSTAWALRALLGIDPELVYDSQVASSIVYLISLRDEATGGWRSSEDSDPFTWATCNACDALRDVTDCLNQKLPSMFRVLIEWHQEHHLVDAYTAKLGRTVYVFNNAASLVFSLVSTLCLILILIISVLTFADSSKLILMVVTGAILLLIGFPWVLHVRAHMVQSWLDAYGIVFGIVGILVGVVMATLAYLR